MFDDEIRCYLIRNSFTTGISSNIFGFRLFMIADPLQNGNYMYLQGLYGCDTVGPVNVMYFVLS